MNDFILAALTWLAAYLVGAIPFGYLVARARGVDILRAGSGNIGATNVGRELGQRFGILVFVLDFAKGALPVALTLLVRPPEAELLRAGLPVGVGLAAFLGHLFPVYLRFRGGKGVATATGVVAVLLPGPTLGALLVWLAVVLATRYVSLASLAAAAALCLFRLAWTPDPFALGSVILTGFCFLAAGLVLARHRANITRLVQGTENRLRNQSMLLLAKTLHVLALGLWFGSVIFFTFIVGLQVFGRFSELSAKPSAERPLWFPVPAEYERERPSERFPEPLRKEQGSRAAGEAVAPLFDYYFCLQAVCCVLALATALPWRDAPETAHKVRLGVLVLALAVVAAGWWVERVVADIRVTRNEASDMVLRSTTPTPESLQTADAARAEFGRWHFYSLMLNLVTVVLVTVAMALAAQLPAASGNSPAEKSGQQTRDALR